MKALIPKLFLCLIVWLALSTGVTKSYFSDRETTAGNAFTAATGFETTSPIIPTPNILPWINEIHYDNASTDTNEGVEIAGPAGLDLTGWTIVLYNGNGGASYDTLNLSGIIPNQQGGYGTLWIGLPVNGLQNGDPADGLALVAPSNTVVQFLSYEGSFVATNGPAAGMNSVNIGVSEVSSTPLDNSLQLQGTGNEYVEFSWTGPTPHTRGLININQTFN